MPVELSEQEMLAHGLKRFMAPGESRVYQAGSCDACQHSGYRGRTGIHELFIMDRAMHQEILSGADATTLHAAARRNGMVTLFEDGLRKVASGISSMEEVLRVTLDQQNDETQKAIEPASMAS